MLKQKLWTLQQYIAKMYLRKTLFVLVSTLSQTFKVCLNKRFSFLSETIRFIWSFVVQTIKLQTYALPYLIMPIRHLQWRFLCLLHHLWVGNQPKIRLLQSMWHLAPLLLLFFVIVTSKMFSIFEVSKLMWTKGYMVSYYRGRKSRMHVETSKDPF